MHFIPSQTGERTTGRQTQYGHTENTESDRQTAAELAGSNVTHGSRAEKRKSTNGMLKSWGRGRGVVVERGLRGGRYEVC